MIVCTITMLVKHKMETHMDIYIFLLILFTLHDENGVAMTKAHVVDYVLKW